MRAPTDGSSQLLGHNLGPAFEIMTPNDLPELGRAVELALGYGHVWGRTSSGKVICWGTDECGELGGISALRGGPT